ncbi:hypothetical protein B0H11DRAFT_2238423 [Mycena galericulata]|nr:hypothetical protein B0H11DRAFT_2238423 [Mycena galericulata]
MISPSRKRPHSVDTEHAFGKRLRSRSPCSLEDEQRTQGVKRKLQDPEDGPPSTRRRVDSKELKRVESEDTDQRDSASRRKRVTADGDVSPGVSYLKRRYEQQLAWKAAVAEMIQGQ